MTKMATTTAANLIVPTVSDAVDRVLEFQQRALMFRAPARFDVDHPAPKKIGAREAARKAPVRQ